MAVAVCAARGCHLAVLAAHQGAVALARTVPFDEAAQQVYEAAEAAGTLDEMIATAYEPNKGPTHFKYVFLTLDDVVLHGARRPSTKVRPIPKDEVERLYPTNVQPNSLSYLIDGIAIYTDVVIQRRDLRRAMRWQNDVAKAPLEKTQ